MEVDQNLLLSAQYNFENCERAIPGLKAHLYYRIAKAQLDEACGTRTVEESLGVSDSASTSHAPYKRGEKG